MLISELAKEIHENAVQHGWWDTKRDPMETIALIHSEWSEALEEARAGRPMVYRLCADCDEGPCEVEPDVATACGFDHAKHKPEGIAVEIIDGCIRILDYFGSVEKECDDEDGIDTDLERLYDEDHENRVLDRTVPDVITELHLLTSLSVAYRIQGKGPNTWRLFQALILGLCWVKKQGLDPMALLMEKHEYNKTRPYKHGKKF